MDHTAEHEDHRAALADNTSLPRTITITFRSPCRGPQKGYSSLAQAPILLVAVRDHCVLFACGQTWRCHWGRGCHLLPECKGTHPRLLAAKPTVPDPERDVAVGRCGKGTQAASSASRDAAMDVT